VRFATYGLATRHRDRLKLEGGAAPPLRAVHPQLAEVRVEFAFEDGTTRAPSDVAFAYFPAARGFFRYPCPCHTCNGEFDLTGQVAELADRSGNQQRSRRVTLSCTGERLQDSGEIGACPVNARIRLTAVLHDVEQAP
jgi:hypothetical protein